MAPQESDTAPFPRRFEVRYSLDEALASNRRRRRHEALFAGTGTSWPRLITFTVLASGLSFLPLAASFLRKDGLSLVATLLSAAFLGGLYAAWSERTRQWKRAERAWRNRPQGVAFGPWDVAVSDAAIEASGKGCGFRMTLAAIREVAINGEFVVLEIDSTLDFAIPKRCFGDDQAAAAFKAFVEARRGSACVA